MYIYRYYTFSPFEAPSKGFRSYDGLYMEMRGRGPEWCSSIAAGMYDSSCMRRSCSCHLCSVSCQNSEFLCFFVVLVFLAGEFDVLSSLVHWHLICLRVYDLD